MPPPVSFRNRVRSILSCCDSRDSTPFEEKHLSVPRPSKGPFSGLKSRPQNTVPCPQTKRWSRGHVDPVESHQQRKNNFAADRSDIAFEDIPQRIFTYDVALFGRPRKKPVYRRLLLDFHGNLDAVSDDIAELLNLPLSPHDGEVRLPNGSLAKPKGVIEVRWHIYGARRRHTTRLVVIPDSPFDMVLGASSIRRCRLWKEDGNIRTELEYHTNKQPCA